MKLKHLLPCVLMSAGLLLAACSSSHKNTDQAAIDEANSSYQNEEAQASGLGDEGTIAGDEQAGGRSLLSKRTYYFNYDSNVVHEEDRAAILANADYLLSHSDVKVIVEGHTDPRGSREYNIGLGERRARAVAEILIGKGVNPGQLRMVSYGAEKLAASGRNEAAYERDRRVVLVYLRR
jgi:peptidoglycan-associated lipoprotein